MDLGRADLILTKGKILTLDPHDTVTEGVAVRDGKIVDRGSTEEIQRLAGDKTQIIDLKGRTVVPGFIDTHTHIDMYGMMTSCHAVDCRIPSLHSVGDILDGIREKASTLPEGTLILGQGRPFQPYPTRNQLDQAAPDHRVIIKASMHWYLFNSCALKHYRIDKSHPTPSELQATDPCAFIQRDNETGEPTGYVEECWNYMFPRSQSPLPYVQTRDAIKWGLDKASSYGITSIVEFLNHPESMGIYQGLHRNGDLHVRVQLVPCFHGVYKTVDLDEIIRVGFQSGFGDEWLKFGGMKLFLDTHQLKPSCTPNQINEWFRKAHRAGLRMFMHAVSRTGQEMALLAIEAEALATGLEGIRTLRHRVEHMGNEDFKTGLFNRAKHLNVIPIPTAYFMNMGPGTLVTPRTERSFLFRTLLDMGFAVPGNSDTAGAVPEALDPLYEIWCMVNRKSLEGNLVSPSEKISVLEALKVYTIHAAYAGCEEEIKGSIEVGKLGDFVVLSRNPLETPEEDLRTIRVDMTIVGGKVVFQRQ